MLIEEIRDITAKIRQTYAKLGECTTVMFSVIVVPTTTTLIISRPKDPSARAANSITDNTENMSLLSCSLDRNVALKDPIASTKRR
ncbi:MAG: hypothetical protein KAW93_06395 [Methanogenium sp.]|nr:hypothetical protein [Methanogenium sp.]